ncbi:MAG: hypothetical protein ACKOX6_15250 [Bdellovibrio sp.]
MKFNKHSVILGFVAIVITMLISNFARDIRTQKEKERLENILTPVIVKAVEGTTDPKPSLSLIIATEKSVMVILDWKQTPESAVKNDMREKISTTIRRELAADPASWGRHLSVTFNNEVVTQGSN